ncbi:hypothetical protein jaqu_10300 [Jannaschia aquimarina]|uniref:Uncharacterized protein n=1 Tax=Jannaschia aquimarina TaxID=935700 RepID=A0A0D1EI62_9RHOB|nr:hypothetical protein jaqu_10300 [Jannaschia aquimarina]SNT19873.1 hypothetical protein SAMN05421775_107156 [Jannaschia aquimarina]
MMREDDVHRFTWMRRSRIAGDSWDREIPLGETRERYVANARVGEQIVWTTETDKTELALDRALREANGLEQGYELEIAQISDEYGPGSWASLSVS